MSYILYLKILFIHLNLTTSQRNKNSSIPHIINTTHTYQLSIPNSFRNKKIFTFQITEHINNQIYDDSDITKYVQEQKLHEQITQACIELAKTRPEDPIKFLGEYLINHSNSLENQNKEKI